MQSATPATGLPTDGRALLERGLAQSHAGSDQALATLDMARLACVAADDAQGAALCAAALLLTGQATNDYRHLEAHLHQLQDLAGGVVRFGDRDQALLAHAGLLSGLLMLAPQDAACDRCATRMVHLLEADGDVNIKYAAGRVLLYYAEPREARALGNRVNALLAPLSEHPDLTPYRLGRWLTMWIGATSFGKDTLQKRRAVEQARALAARGLVPEVMIFIATMDLDAALPRRDFEAAQAALRLVEAKANPAKLNDLRRIEWFAGRIALARGQGEAALFHAERARKYAEQMAVPPPMLGVMVALEAQARVLTGDLEGARERLLRTIDMVAVLHVEEMRDMLRMVDAYEAACLGRADTRDKLAAAFAAPRARRFYDSFDTNPRFGATMCALALEHGVEVEFVRQIIELHDIVPPAGAGASWPWAVRIVTLGAHQLVCDGRPVTFRAKAQRKPLELLKALIAYGGRGVDKRRLAEALWFDTAPDAADAALGMAILRLRKLLGRSDAITLEDGKVSLNAERVWTDLWAFEREVDALQRAVRTSGEDRAVEPVVERMLALYRGAFLEHEEPQRWMLAARDRARNRFLRSIADAGRVRERAQRYDAAIDLYERGLEADPVAEDLYRALIRCHLALGHAADAARAYHRCRTMLASELDVEPSAETQALFDSIYKR
jgi:LuxR family maltose regulon positive regulatory protein